MLAATGSATDRASRDAIDRDLTALLEAVQAGRSASFTNDADTTEETDDEDDFLPMTVHPLAVERSRDDLGTPEWAIGKGLGEVLRYNAFRGKRDLKMLHGTRGEEGALWELRVRDGRLPVRLMYQLDGHGPKVVAIIAKQDDEHQRRLIERVQGWVEGGG